MPATSAQNEQRLRPCAGPSLPSSAHLMRPLAILTQCAACVFALHAHALSLARMRMPTHQYGLSTALQGALHVTGS
jgi:hypothetical protein